MNAYSVFIQDIKMRYHVFNIGQPSSIDWWRKIRALGIILAGFDGVPGDRGDEIMRDIDAGDWVIAYANRIGFVGAGIAGGPETYRLVANKGLAPDWKSNNVHVLNVDWLYYADTLETAISAREANRSAPRQTKEKVSDLDAAKALVELIGTRMGTKSSLFPDEVPPGPNYFEGAVKQILVDRFERSPEAREACIAHWGCHCMACGLDFALRYGELGTGFIHVHHLTPISLIGDSHSVNPVADLRPVCPNCHSMLHRSNPPMSIEALKLLINWSFEA